VQGFHHGDTESTEISDIASFLRVLCASVVLTFWFWLVQVRTGFTGLTGWMAARTKKTPWDKTQNPVNLVNPVKRRLR
jgi:hypothetical protein